MGSGSGIGGTGSGSGMGGTGSGSGVGGTGSGTGRAVLTLRIELLLVS